MDTCHAGRIDQKTTQLSGDFYENGNPFLVDFYGIEKSNPSKGVFVVSSSVTTVN
jgi:hypothetical protein